MFNGPFRSRIPLPWSMAVLIALAAPGAQTASAQTNLALNRPTSGSLPCNAEETTAKAVNGSVAGGTTDKWCSEQPGKFLQVDLGSSHNVVRVVVKHAASGGEGAELNTRDFNIQVSTNGTSFTTVASVAGNSAGTTSHEIAAAAARFVRLEVTAGEQGGGGAARIYELEVYEDAAPPSGGNLALGKPATGSAPCNAQEGPAKAVNGSVSGGNSDKWCSRAATKFLQVDLGASVGVRQFVVRHAGAGGEGAGLNTRAFNIQVSTNGTTFTTVATVTNNTASVTTHSIAARQARFVRLNVTQAEQSAGGAARIYELEVFGDGGGGGPEPCGRADGFDYLRVYRSSLSTWCVEANLWAQHAADIQKFFAYGDAVVTTLQELFAVTPQGLPFTYQAEPPNGGAHTGSDFGLGVGVTGDAFFNDFEDPISGAPVRGFWGYLLTLHEAINVWTGEVTDNWPTDWWADHRSPFPNSMDFHVMDTIGTAQNDANLKAAALAQHRRMGVPGGPEFDSEVAMFDDLFNRFGGFPAFARVFALIQRDGLKWAQVAPNPSPLLSEYVIAYVSLGIRTPADLTQSSFVAAGVGTKDDQIPPYTVSARNVGDIADAHCSINAASPRPAAALAALRRGDFRNALVSAACGASCPAECGCDTTRNQCVALWRAR